MKASKAKEGKGTDEKIARDKNTLMDKPTPKKDEGKAKLKPMSYGAKSRSKTQMASAKAAGWQKTNKSARKGVRDAVEE